jgi:hypothetical protein
MTDGPPIEKQHEPGANGIRIINSDNQMAAPRLLPDRNLKNNDASLIERIG